MGKKRDESGGGDVQSEAALQGIIVADCFDESHCRSFAPFDDSEPLVLMEVCGRCLLEYGIEFLARCGVEEIIVACGGKQAMKIETVVHRLDATELDIKKITMCVVAGSTSVGDIYRELDQRGIVESDPFIVLSGNAICGLEPSQVAMAIENHKIRRKQFDPDAAVTLFLWPGGPRAQQHLSPLLDDDLIIAFESETKRVVTWYDAAWKTTSTKNALFHIPAEAMQDCPRLTIRNDLIDTRIELCSPQVLLRYSENFDYQEARRDFVANEVANTSLGLRVYAHILHGSYGAVVKDPRSLRTVCADLCLGWGPKLKYHANESRRGLVLQTPVHCNAMLVAPCYIGADCKLCDRTLIDRSTLCDSCEIGHDAKIQASYLGSRVKIGAKAKVGPGALLAADVIVDPGVVVGTGAVLGPGFHAVADVPAFARLKVMHATNPNVAEAFSFNDDEADDEDDENENNCAPPIDPRVATSMAPPLNAKISRAALWRNAFVDLDDLEDDPIRLDDDIEIDQFGDDHTTETKEDITQNGMSCTQRSGHFTQNIREMIRSGYDAKADVGSMLMELNCYKLSENRSFREAAPAVLDSVIGLAVRDAGENPTSAALILQIKKLIQHWTPVLLKLLNTNHNQDQAFTLDSVILNTPALREKPAVARAALQFLYEADVLSDEAIIQWAKTTSLSRLTSDPQIIDFLEWLQEDEEDSDDDEDDDGSDDEDSDN
mmetsp:Transcript_9728/g.13512  ORF Transcript_9728/g.13512 Transcript_9728/m.13512 type:complete len:717 (+) Transcript_9728:112-2262(+)|eukprot:CAMPEP_0197303574 /NCGR_PEP_ID=MMETSP0890-20130614/51744_1 /TAXON_ID=44058 ORGANISM="Aureoumbra lagunensis, Strain CCMP1510" /NCGR_SAMPLE_ID=MMETSP0890 /ASSEMBLY_ACC=CAM_ASM_000533 /LENGTH=716 /DNA_ID=CAMNT_0042783431 /DNA_START=100 /DNA_END=2250 /DNA_ORIENTATION=-